MNRVTAAKVAGALALAAILGVLGVSAGLVPLSAREGHWAITEWFLSFTMRRTVKARSVGITAPSLEDPALVVRGAGHYETGCRPCHGAPRAFRPVPLRHMTPRPPVLSEQVRHWDANDLFWIVKNGIKFTGMPGWPASERDDEVWAMVAFLRELPEMSRDEYHRLAFGEAAPLAREEPTRLEDLRGAPPREVVTNCGRCHGIDGQGGLHEAFPKLAGQSEAYLLASLDAYAEGARASGMMESIAAALSEDDALEAARYFSRLEGLGGAGAVEASSAGAIVATEGVPARRVPSCADCHGPGSIPRRAAYPRLAGQHASYLIQQIELFKSGARGGTDYAHLMHPVASRIPADAIRDVAEYYASLGRRGSTEIR